MYFQAAKLLLFYEISKKKLKNIQKKIYVQPFCA